jgi:hypothetical protein
LQLFFWLLGNDLGYYDLERARGLRRLSAFH